MAEYRCPDCGNWYRGVPIHLLVTLSRKHKTECTGKPTTNQDNTND